MPANRLKVNHFDFVALHSMWIIFLKGYCVLVRVEYTITPQKNCPHRVKCHKIIMICAREVNFSEKFASRREIFAELPPFHNCGGSQKHQRSEPSIHFLIYGIGVRSLK